MCQIMENSLHGFITALASKEPVPGGGGASALLGAIGAALCSMVANLTVGKMKYAQYQEDMENIRKRAGAASEKLLLLIAQDAEASAPLAAAYGIPKDEPGRDERLEGALIAACVVPMEIMKAVRDVVELAEEAAAKGSKLVLSDAAVAAAACRGALTGAAMNVFINTRLMKNRKFAAETDAEASLILKGGCERCDKICCDIMRELSVDN